MYMSADVFSCLTFPHSHTAIILLGNICTGLCYQRHGELHLSLTSFYSASHPYLVSSAIPVISLIPLKLTTVFPGVKVPRENACATKTCGITRILADLRKFRAIRVNGRSGGIRRMRH